MCINWFEPHASTRITNGKCSRQLLGNSGFFSSPGAFLAIVHAWVFTEAWIHAWQHISRMAASCAE
ncbi:hypothetical protein CBOM_07769 [Ceraceosorus bombacis]|uniref:Uncharacterized protein n=1 Tax=Ceraceosorus bombacis TaxID=401625 RepID=A0A0P1BPK4_9BASI|nr:hypothetical protein CBOM_07769 [Ceraceosorus bombacis]